MPVEIGLGLQDLFAGRDTRRAAAAAFTFAETLIKINSALEPQKK